MSGSGGGGGQAPLDMGKWRGLFEWSMKHQQDGGGGGAPVGQLDPEKRQWLEAALQEMMKDFADRMREITASLAADGGSNGGAPTAAAAAAAAAASLADKEALCDELMEIVENVDYARDLHTIGGLPTLLSLMASPHPSLRWRAAEIAATCMANNPPVQRWFMEGGALPPLLGLLSDAHPMVATKGVLGLSALMRHYEPGMEAFRLAGGLNKLLALLGCHTDASVPPACQKEPAAPAGAGEDGGDEQQQQRRRRLQRKVLALLQYVLAKHPADAAAAAEFGVVAQLQRLLTAPGADADMRAASLAVLSEVLATPDGWSWVRQHDGSLLAAVLEVQQHTAGGEEEPDEDEAALLSKVLALLRASKPPPQVAAAAGLKDHVELDPALDGGSAKRAEPHSLPLQQPGGGGGGDRAGAAPASGPSGGAGGLALVAVPKPDLR